MQQNMQSNYNQNMQSNTQPMQMQQNQNYSIPIENSPHPPLSPNFQKGQTTFCTDLDNETDDILNSISEPLRNAFILLAIKNLKLDPIYSFFAKEVESDEIIQTNNSNLTSNTTSIGPNNRNVNEQRNPVSQPQTTEAPVNTDVFSSW